VRVEHARHGVERLVPELGAVEPRRERLVVHALDAAHRVLDVLVGPAWAVGTDA